MELSEIRKLVKLVESSGIQEIEIEREGTRIRISKADPPAGNSAVPVMMNPLVNTPVTVQAPAASAALSPQGEVLEAPGAVEVKPSYHEIKSPMVGTFYSSPSPDAEPYVKAGDQVKQGQVMCIVEAMKLMNEIESDVSGRVVEILSENAQPVEFGQAMFLIDTKA